MAEFGDRRAVTHRQKTVSLRDLSKRLPPAKSKETMNHIKLGAFTGEPTAKGSYRHNAAHESVSGVEGDYDQGTMSPQDAVAALAKAGLAAQVYIPRQAINRTARATAGASSAPSQPKPSPANGPPCWRGLTAFWAVCLAMNRSPRHSLSTLAGSRATLTPKCIW